MPDNSKQSPNYSTLTISEGRSLCFVDICTFFYSLNHCLKFVTVEILSLAQKRSYNTIFNIQLIIIVTTFKLRKIETKAIIYSFGIYFNTFFTINARVRSIKLCLSWHTSFVFVFNTIIMMLNKAVRVFKMNVFSRFKRTQISQTFIQTMQLPDCTASVTLSALSSLTKMEVTWKWGIQQLPSSKITH